MAKDILVPCGASMGLRVSEIDDLELAVALSENSDVSVREAIRAEIIFRSRIASRNPLINQRSIRSYIHETVSRAAAL